MNINTEKAFELTFFLPSVVAHQYVDIFNHVEAKRLRALRRTHTELWVNCPSVIQESQTSVCDQVRLSLSAWRLGFVTLGAFHCA